MKTYPVIWFGCGSATHVACLGQGYTGRTHPSPGLGQEYAGKIHSSPRS